MEEHRLDVKQVKELSPIQANVPIDFSFLEERIDYYSGITILRFVVGSVLMGIKI